MTCTKCKNPAVFLTPRYCKNHFIEYFEGKVLDTIRRYRLIKEEDRIVVAASGGKDSTACLHILSKHYKVTALAIDEGIRGYRAKTLADLKRFCRSRRIKLHIVSCKKELGKTLDSIATKGKSSCSLCGAMRRHLLNIHAKRLGATVIATGHNMDDEAQSIMMNFFKNNLAMSARLGPVSGLSQARGFVRRVKPLYHCSEKESYVYNHLAGLGTGFNECPYTNDSFRNSVRGIINEWEKIMPGAKKNIIRNFLKMVPKLRKIHQAGHPRACAVCGEPCAEKICIVCKIVTKRHA